jgi:LysM repeat protein
MPVATIGLFALALIVIGLAFAIDRVVGGDGDDNITPADVVATAAALNKTQTATAGGGEQTQPPATTATNQPGGNQTTAPTTTGTRTPTAGTPAAGGTYVVEAGDTCGAIAAENDVTLAELLDANDMTEADCSSLDVGQELTIP